ncbi:Kti12p [Lachancea thermotolerans CBS 6340]|uniref:KLTH0D05192p n=1 Tax=Lachancea thermotolerans (strain ATCC 56472 / CBS 6340 / NRRL Y-8284) TaxID=559295 RepID=C5DGG7_LACTC|nr:KLTH0D05192p [Lachancea thermotolerans CBS 6340]CAR22509.1 KLTH0D05192p [Lachancea thermotolerans CBS 6340]
MPLVLFTGFPSSGKTSKAKELVELLSAKIEQEPELSKYSIVCHSDESLGIQHTDYVTSQDERKLRSKIMSAVKRDLSRHKIVVVDSLNYIKGFRYQLHCEVKNLMTTYCLVHVMSPSAKILEWNESTADGRVPWPTDLLNQLIQRYEEPNPQTRWDSPLIPVLASEDSLQSFAEPIYKALFPQLYRSDNDREADKLLNSLKPNNATILKPATQTNALQVLDSETTAVVKKVMSALQSNVVAGVSRIIVSDVQDINDERCMYVEMPPQGVTVAQLQRIRRQFVAMNRLRSLEKHRIAPLFVDYLNKNLRDM